LGSLSLLDAVPIYAWSETLAFSVESFVHNIRGYHHRAAELAASAVAAADRSDGMEAHRLVPLVFHGFALHSSGRESAARAAWQRGEQLADELGAAWAAPFFHYGRAITHWDYGRWGDLLAETDAAIDFARFHGTALAVGFACAVGAAAHLFQRRPELACKLLDEGDEMLSRGGVQYGADWLAWIRALHLEATGHALQALELLDGAWQVASALRAEAALSLFGPDLVRLHVLAGQIDRADTVLSHLERTNHDSDRTTVDASTRAWRAALEDDRAALADVRATYAAFPRPVQLVLVDEAAMIGAVLRGDLAEARARLRDVIAGADRLDCPGIGDRAERAARQLGLSIAPERRAPRPVSGWGALTDTERTVARMVASGHSNVAIADSLGISRRTVESHLYHSFSKLNVSNRTELAVVALRELGAASPSAISSSAG
jgi:DNA-binding CsgD family transcriptional regulator